MRTLLIDGNNTCFQALGKAPLHYNGQRTEVIKIALGMVRSYIEKFQPDTAIVAWDGGRDERRTSIYPDYKRKKREWTEDEKAEREILFEQMRQLMPVFTSLGLQQFKVKGREGDDLIFTLLCKGWVLDGEQIVVSTDQDMFQLFSYSSQVLIYSPIRKLMINADYVEQEFGIQLKDFAFYKAMVGDGSDNLPGIHGIGPKKAQQVMDAYRGGHNEYGHKLLEQVLNNEDELTKQMTLVTLMAIPDEEIVAGHHWSAGFKEDEVLQALEKYGLAQFLERYSDWSAPFIQMQQRNRVVGTWEAK